MSMPIQIWGPCCEVGTEERISPERPEPQPTSRIREGWGRERSSSARWVIDAWMFCIREEVVYLRASVSL